MTDPNSTPAEPGATHTGGGEKKATTPQPTVSTELVRRAKRHYRFLQGEEGTPYAVAAGAKSPNVVLPLRGRDGVRQRLARDYYETRKAVPSGAALADALAVLEGEAAAQPRERVALRLARHGDTIVIDRGDPDGRHIVVRPGGWTYPNAGQRSPVLFRRTALTGELPVPRRGFDVEGLAELVNADRSTVRLLIAWLVSALIPEIPHPILAVFGEQGTAKTTLMRLLSMLIDPSPAPTRTAPRDLGVWAVTASGSWLVALDNLSSVPDWLSDALCRAVTGDALTTRALYSDGDIHVMEFRRVIALTSIDAGALRGDLGERLLPIELQRITPGNRRTDAGVAEEFAAAAPGLLGGLLDLLAEVLDVLPDVHPAELGRMADFTRVLVAVDAVKGWSTAKTYTESARDIAESVVESDPVATVIRAVVRAQPFNGTAEDLRKLLNDHLRGQDEKAPRGWPSNAKVMGGALKRVTPALRELGFEVTTGRHSGGSRTRWIKINPPPCPACGTPPGTERADACPSCPGYHADQCEPSGRARPGGDAAGTTPHGTGTSSEPGLSRVDDPAEQQERATRDKRDKRDEGSQQLDDHYPRDLWRRSGLPVSGVR